ncbi:MAG: NAD(P)-binding domain-containing protein [Bacteroidales bacterium]|nr:NAD(P)-binding domain-containing protein [Bacteroidales bacterium]
MNANTRIAVLGGGSWATALVKLLLNNCDQLNWFFRGADDIQYIKKFHHNPKYLSSVQLPIEKIRFYNNMSQIIENSDILVFAIPAPFLKESLRELNTPLQKKFIVSAIKGIVPNDNLTVAEFFNKNYSIPFSSIGIISGPCHAEEVALERLSYLTISCKSKIKAEFIASRLRCNYLKANISKDIYGTEYAAVLKNIYAISAGICHGLGYGDNFIAVLVSNATQEIKRFLDSTYKNKRRINSSAYLGDLLVTSYSQFSRNRTFGTMIGKGYSPKNAQLEMNMIAEGYFAVKCINEINKEYNVKMPICDAVYNVLYDKIAPAIEIQLLTEKLK